MTRGQRINRRAWLAAQIVRLDVVIPETEKLSRKTPPKTLAAEQARVLQAGKDVVKLKRERQLYVEELETLRARDTCSVCGASITKRGEARRIPE